MTKSLHETPATHCKRKVLSTDSLEIIYQDIIILLDQIIKSVTVEAPHEII